MPINLAHFPALWICLGLILGIWLVTSGIALFGLARWMHLNRDPFEDDETPPLIRSEVDKPARAKERASAA